MGAWPEQRGAWSEQRRHVVGYKRGRGQIVGMYKRVLVGYKRGADRYKTLKRALVMVGYKG